MGLYAYVTTPPSCALLTSSSLFRGHCLPKVAPFGPSLPTLLRLSSHLDARTVPYTFCLWNMILFSIFAVSTVQKAAFYLWLGDRRCRGGMEGCAPQIFARRETRTAAMKTRMSGKTLGLWQGAQIAA